MSENQGLLDAIRVIVGEAVAPLTGRMDGFDGKLDRLTERVDGLTERMDQRFAQIDERFAQIDEHFAQIDERFTQMDQRFTQTDLRLSNLEGICMRLENEIATVETRTGQMSSDIADLLELQDKVNEGFRAFKSDFQRAFIDIGAVQETQKGQQREMKQLRDRVDMLERRLAKLEDRREAR